MVLSGIALGVESNMALAPVESSSDTPSKPMTGTSTSTGTAGINHINVVAVGAIEKLCMAIL
jgi:hypothetical protein